MPGRLLAPSHQCQLLSPSLLMETQMLPLSAWSQLTRGRRNLTSLPWLQVRIINEEGGQQTIPSGSLQALNI